MRTSRDAVRALVDDLPEEELDTAEQLLKALCCSPDPEQIEALVDALTVRRLRAEQNGDQVETLDEFGARLGLE